MIGLQTRRCDGATTSPWHRTLLCAILAGIFVWQPLALAQQTGDVNSDTLVDATDRQLVIDHVLGRETLEGQAFAAGDLNEDGNIDAADVTAFLGLFREDTHLLETSPRNGEQAVALTRETVFRFNNALEPASAADGEAFTATFGGEDRAFRVQVSRDARTVTLFYNDRLPDSARVRVTIDGGMLMDTEGELVDVDGDGQPGGMATIDFDTVSLTSSPGTTVSGRVFASQLGESKGGDPVNICLEGVKITVDGAEDEMFAFTDELGNFTLDPAPVGRFFVHIDGRTVTNALIDGVRVDTFFPEGPYYPNVGKAWEASAGIDNPLENIYLPVIPAGTLVEASTTSETVLTFNDEFLAENPQFLGVEVRVPAGALLNEDGSPGGMVGIAPVPPDRLPGPLPANLPLQDVVTIQTDGAANFNEPVPICLPNLPDPETGEVLAPGSSATLMSFNHDTGRFEPVGTMTVSADGLTVCSDPGSGILAPGWHGVLRFLQVIMPWHQCQGNDAFCLCSKAIVAFALPNFPANNVTPVISIWNLANNVRNSKSSDEKVVMVGLLLALVAGINMAYGIRSLARCVSLTNSSKFTNKGQSNTCGFPFTDSELRLIEDKLLPSMNLIADIVTTTFSESRSLLEDELNEVLDIYLGAFDGLTPTEFESLVTLTDRSFANLECYLPEPSIIDDLYYRVIFSDGEVLRGKLPRGESGEIGIGTDVAGDGFTVSVYDPSTNSLSSGAWVSESNIRKQAGFTRPKVQLTQFFDDLTGAADIDEDGLADWAEGIIGTNYLSEDTDGDGISDGAEIENGTNPLDGLLVETGIIATADTPGTAVDICAVDNLAIVADGEEGVSVFNVFNGMDPVIIAQVDTPGFATAVSCGSNRIVVADGASGLQIIDITDPPAASIVHSIPGSAFGTNANVNVVVASGEDAFVGASDGTIARIDLRDGVILGSVNIGSAVQDLSISGEYVYASTNGRLHAIEFATSGLRVDASIASPGTPNSFHGRGGVFAGTDYAYAVHSAGYNVFDIRDPETPEEIRIANEFGRWSNLVSTGSGIGVVAFSDDAFSSIDNIAIVDLSDPQASGEDSIRLVIDTPGRARDVAIYNGLAYVADHTSGLQVINFEAYDALGNAPTGTLTTSAVEGEATEGASVVLRANVTDDVQARNVEFYVDGVLVTIDGAFPFETLFRVPMDSAGETFEFTAIASDTGGNVLELLEPETFTAIADVESPEIQNITFLNDAMLETTSFNVGDALTVNVDASDLVGIDPRSFAFEIDGVLVDAIRRSATGWYIQVPDEPGTYTLTVALSDFAGNMSMGSMTFDVFLMAISRAATIFNVADSPGIEAVSRPVNVFNLRDSRIDLMGGGDANVFTFGDLILIDLRGFEPDQVESVEFSVDGSGDMTDMFLFGDYYALDPMVGSGIHSLTVVINLAGGGMVEETLTFTIVREAITRPVTIFNTKEGDSIEAISRPVHIVNRVPTPNEIRE